MRRQRVPDLLRPAIWIFRIRCRNDRESQMKDAAPTVFIVGRDRTLLAGLRRLLTALHLPVEIYATAQKFKEAHDPHRPGCLILDVPTPETIGMSLFRRLRREGSSIPVIFLTRRADVLTAVRAMREGVFDFLVKPVEEQYLAVQVQQAIALDLRNRRQAVENKSLAARFAGLSAREQEVLAQIVAGKSNKATGVRLGIATRTVGFHRANIMRKVGAKTVVELVSLLLRSGWKTPMTD